MAVTSDSGIGVHHTIDQRTSTLIACLLTLAIYNVLELSFLIFSVFKIRRSLYFWSFLIATWGIPFYAVGFMLKYVDGSTERILIVVLISVGWCCMVTGQSFVLYSRLHLVLWNQTYLRFVLVMIIFDAIICHIPPIVMAAGANTTNATPYILAYSVYEKVQVTIFFIQELTISALYIFEAAKLLRSESNIRGRKVHRVKSHLILVNLVIIALDITILALEYAHLYDIQTSFKAFAYSLKLKLEFSILNRLVELMESCKATTLNSSTGLGAMPLNTFKSGSCIGKTQTSAILAATVTKSTGEEEEAQRPEPRTSGGNTVGTTQNT